MVFISICTAVYDYPPQGDGELALQEGELVYVLEKSSEDDWWKAKKRAANEEEEEPTGLIPYNYVEEVSVGDMSTSTNHSRVLKQYRKSNADMHCIPRPAQLIMPKRCMTTLDRQMRSFPFPKMPHWKFTIRPIRNGPWWV